jgi:hypothetical protein
MTDKHASYRLTRRILAAALLLSAFAAAQSATRIEGPIGPGDIVVRTRFQGQVFGFDVDENGTEGVLAESQSLSNGKVLAAVESFDQKTGKILNVVIKTETQDDFVTMGVVGKGVGLVEREHVISFLHIKRTFHLLNPLGANKFSGVWTPPIGTKHLIMPAGVSRSQGVPRVAVFASDNSGQFIPYVFSSDVAANRFGPIVKITDSNNFGSVEPPIAFDSKTNQAVLGGGPGCFGCLPVIGVADLAKGSFTEFTGIGFGFINGVAVDSADGIACTTTEDDASVEFYDLKTQTGFSVQLPGSGGQQFFSGADVEYDPMHKVFLIAQPNSSSAPSGSTIYVYDTKGNLQNTLNGFNFSNAFSVIFVHIALNPKHRTGFVDDPAGIRSFTY